jgi:nucleoside-diphosphate-sugar epimerase
MKFSEVKTDKHLWEFMTTPSEKLIECIRRLDGPVMILGGSGKMGKELTGLIRHADKELGVRREISVASTFSDPSGDDIILFESLGVHCFKGDLSDEKFLASLPEAPNVVYMMGFKFGSSSDWQRAFHLNSIIPYLVGKKYEKSKIIVFSSGNPYPHTPKNGKGCTEESPLSPEGIYGWSIVARESSFGITARQSADQKIAFYRLMYAQHLNYGVLVDLARMVWNGEAISLAMPAVNLVSQRDANEIALRAFDFCQNNPWIINVAGPVWQVKDIVERLEFHLGKKAILLPDEADLALLADDSKCTSTFGSYRDEVEDMIEGAASWVKNRGTSWNKPTKFGQANHKY